MHQNTHTKRVFVIDPDEAVRDSIHLLLESAGLGVHAFADATSFLRHAATDVRGCLLMETGLPDSNGLQVISALRDMNVHIPALLMTSSNDPWFAHHARRAGAAGLIRKPLRHNTLIERVTALLHFNEMR